MIYRQSMPASDHLIVAGYSCGLSMSLRQTGGNRFAEPKSLAQALKER
jgi:hypothetical protein